MESNRIEGIGHQVKGAVMEGLGKAIGDEKQRAAVEHLNCRNAVTRNHTNASAP
jgi:hypothetical protein